ncbi:TIGR03790 family protein [Methylocaldum sp. MU1018]
MFGKRRRERRGTAERLCWLVLLLAAAVFRGAQAEETAGRRLLSWETLGPRELAVIVNEADPSSIAIGGYYQKRRSIPDENVIRVSFPPGSDNLPRAQFESVKQTVDKLTPSRVQAYALAWMAPYRVDCMSMTSAFAFGFDQAYCSTKCGETKPSEYFHSASRAPYRDYGIRPAMMLAGRTVQDVRHLIDRGVASDHTYPAGTGYLVNTSDRHRTVRAATFDETIDKLGAAIRLRRVEADFISDKRDVLFYFTGRAKVPDLDTLSFVPGAMADHLTSFGGRLTESAQMSSVRWLEAGATASYGTMAEPCNITSKFPYPAVAIWHYLEGDTVLEAYWKSVARPGEGVFIGEPLAAPFAPRMIDRDGRIMLKLFSPRPRVLALQASASAVGPYRSAVKTYPVKPGYNELSLRLPDAAAFYRLTYAGSGGENPGNKPADTAGH